MLMERNFKPEGLASCSLGFAKPQENDHETIQIKGEPQRGSVRVAHPRWTEPRCGSP